MEHAQKGDPDIAHLTFTQKSKCGGGCSVLLKKEEKKREEEEREGARR